MERPPSPHPKKLATILENYELNAFNEATNKVNIAKVITKLEKISEEIKEIKDILEK